MADAETDVLVLNDLPIPENRDLAWKMLRERGDSVQLDSDLAPDGAVDRRSCDAPSGDLLLEAGVRHPQQPGPAPAARVRPPGADPVQAFLAFFGLPADDLPQFMVWKDAILESSDGSGTATESGSAEHAIALFTYLGGLVQSRRGVSGDDVLSQLLCIEGDDALSDAEAIGLCFLFVLAGLDTVTGALGLGMERLAKNPGRRKEIVANPGIVPAAVEELVRLDPPAPFTPRVTTQETVLDAQRRARTAQPRGRGSRRRQKLSRARDYRHHPARRSPAQLTLASAISDGYVYLADTKERLWT